MKVAVIGIGRIGQVHARNLIRHPDIDSLVLVDTDHQKSLRVARELGCRSVEDVEAALQLGVDGVVVSTPTIEHVRTLDSIAHAGVAVFCEKPLAATIEETIQSIKVVTTAGIPLQVGFQRRFDSGYLAARKAYQSGQLGRPLLIRGCTLDPAPPPPGYIAMSGGIFWDCSIHDLDAILWVTARHVVSVMALGNAWGIEFAEANDSDSAQAILQLDDGAVASVAATRYNSAGYDARLEIHGTCGAVAAGLSDRSPIRSLEEGVEWPAGVPYEQFTDRFAAAYAAEMEAFVDLMHGGRSQCLAEDALEAQRVAFACELSRQESRMVNLGEVPGL